MGRTGTFSISEQLGLSPDLITLAKSLGSGVPVGAVLASDAIAAGVEHGDQGSTFGGGMLAMAAVIATLETILEDGLMDQARVIHQQIHSVVGPLVKEVRGRGCLIGLELDGRAAGVIPDAPVAAAAFSAAASSSARARFTATCPQIAPPTSNTAHKSNR